MKACTTCYVEKPLEEFHKKAMGYLGHDSVCKVCRSAKKRTEKPWRSEKSKEAKKAYKEANREAIREKDRAYEQKNKEHIAARKRQYRQDKRAEIAIKRRERYVKNKKQAFQYHYDRLKTDTNYYLKHILRSRISNFLNGVGKTGSAVKDLGCTIEELKLHLERQFTTGMTWENKGKWHVDHIIPLCKFDLTRREEFLKACHYSNLQPLWAIDNMRKNRFG